MDVGAKRLGGKAQSGHLWSTSGQIFKPRGGKLTDKCQIFKHLADAFYE